MSPQSRKRKRKPARKGRNEPPTPDQIIARVVRDTCAHLESEDDPLRAEGYVSETLGAWWHMPMIDADPEVVFGEAVVAKAANRRRTGALALLRCVAELGTERQRAAAADAADKLAAGGVAEPPWAGVLGTERVTAAWARGDVYGDETAVLLEVERAGVEHGVVVYVDHTLDGIAEDAFITTEPSAVLADLRSNAEPGDWMRELTAQEAAGVLVPAFAATDAAVEPPIDDDFRTFRALALARVRLLGPAPAEEPAPRVGVAERRMIVTQFLGSDAGKELPEAARSVVEMLVDFGCDVDRGQPLRVSPAKLGRFLGEWLLDRPELEPEVADALPAALRAWARWAAERTELPDEAVSELLDAVEEMVDEQVAGELDVGSMPGEDVVERYLDDVDLDALEPEDLRDLVYRRVFTVPSVNARIRGEDYSDLDPSDDDDRGLLIQGEHPEYQAALDDPDTGEVDGANPRLHIAIHQIVATQLWDNDPPEAWHAAQRLLADDWDRHDVLHAIGEVLVGHMHGVLAGQGAFDRKAYVADLDALGKPKP